MKTKLAWFFERFGSPILVFLLGTALLLWPAASGIILCRVLGAALVAGGCLRLWTYIRQRQASAAFLVPWNLAVGTVLAAVGVFFLLQPQAVLSVLPVMLGLLLLFTAVPKGLHALRLRQYRWDRWWIPLAAAVALGGLGLVFLFRPFQTAASLLRLVGACLIASGLVDLWLEIWLRRLEDGPGGEAIL